MSEKILVTGYKNPDLDGVACAYAYAEFLEKKGKTVKAGVFGKPHIEAGFILDYLGGLSLSDAEEIMQEYSNVIIVDSSDLRGIAEKINPARVTEIIDHRQVHEADQFPNAKAQIELVGSCATLIAEKFYVDKIEISKESAVLLYSAIVSNTINFKATVTTDRDKKMADWLLSQYPLPATYIRDMFDSKSKFSDSESVRIALEGDYSSFSFSGNEVVIFQLEIIGVEDFLNRNWEILNKILHEHAEETLVFLTCVDLFEGYNMFLVLDKAGEDMLHGALGVHFDNRRSHRDGIIMRKQIVPLLKEYFEKQGNA